MNKYDKDLSAIEEAQYHIGQAQRALRGIKHADVEDLDGSLSMAESEADLAEAHTLDAANEEEDRLFESNAP